MAASFWFDPVRLFMSLSFVIYPRSAYAHTSLFRCTFYYVWLLFLARPEWSFRGKGVYRARSSLFGGFDEIDFLAMPNFAQTLTIAWADMSCTQIERAPKEQGFVWLSNMLVDEAQGCAFAWVTRAGSRRKSSSCVASRQAIERMIG